MLYPGDQYSLDVELLYHGVRFDPSTSVNIVLTLPDASTVTYVYGVDSEITKDAIGLYSVDFVIPSASTSVGVWSYEWTGTDSAVVVQVTGTFEVYDSADLVVLSVEDQDTNPVVGAFVEVRDSGEKIVWGGTTNSSGQVSLQLADGSYKAKISKVGFSFSSTYSFVVAGVTSPSAFSGTDLSIALSPTLSLCRLYGYVRSLDSSANSRASVFVTEARSSFVGTGATGVKPENVGITRNMLSLAPRKADGYWEVDLVQGSQVSLKIPSMRYEVTFRVPEQESLNFADIRHDPNPRRGNQKGTPQNF